MVAVSEGTRWKTHTVTFMDGSNGALMVDFTRSLRQQKAVCTARVIGMPNASVLFILSFERMTKMASRRKFRVKKKNLELFISHWKWTKRLKKRPNKQLMIFSQTRNRLLATTAICLDENVCFDEVAHFIAVLTGNSTLSHVTRRTIRCADANQCADLANTGKGTAPVRFSSDPMR